MDATQPQNDREFLIQLSAHMDKLSDSIDNLSTVVTNVEIKRILPLELKIEEFGRWKAKVGGIWATIIGLSALASLIAVILSIVQAFHK